MKSNSSSNFNGMNEDALPAVVIQPYDYLLVIGEYETVCGSRSFSPLWRWGMHASEMLDQRSLSTISIIKTPL